MNWKESFKAFMRVVFICGLVVSIDAIVNPAPQSGQALIGGIATSLGVWWGWYDFEDS